MTSKRKFVSSPTTKKTEAQNTSSLAYLFGGETKTFETSRISIPGVTFRLKSATEVKKDEQLPINKPLGLFEQIGQSAIASTLRKIIRRPKAPEDSASKRPKRSISPLVQDTICVQPKTKRTFEHVTDDNFVTTTPSKKTKLKTKSPLRHTLFSKVKQNKANLQQPNTPTSTPISIKPPILTTPPTLPVIPNPPTVSQLFSPQTETQQSPQTLSTTDNEGFQTVCNKKSKQIPTPHVVTQNAKETISKANKVIETPKKSGPKKTVQTPKQNSGESQSVTQTKVAALSGGSYAKTVANSTRRATQLVTKTTCSSSPPVNTPKTNSKTLQISITSEDSRGMTATGFAKSKEHNFKKRICWGLNINLTELTKITPVHKKGKVLATVTADEAVITTIAEKLQKDRVFVQAQNGLRLCIQLKRSPYVVKGINTSTDLYELKRSLNQMNEIEIKEIHFMGKNPQDKNRVAVYFETETPILSDRLKFRVYSYQCYWGEQVCQRQVHKFDLNAANKNSGLKQQLKEKNTPEIIQNVEQSAKISPPPKLTAEKKPTAQLNSKSRPSEKVLGPSNINGMSQKNKIVPPSVPRGAVPKMDCPPPSFRGALPIIELPPPLLRGSAPKIDHPPPLLNGAVSKMDHPRPLLRGAVTKTDRPPLFTQPLQHHIPRSEKDKDRMILELMLQLGQQNIQMLQMQNHISNLLKALNPNHHTPSHPALGGRRDF